MESKPCSIDRAAAVPKNLYLDLPGRTYTKNIATLFSLLKHKIHVKVNCVVFISILLNHGNP